ncbi:hypothetical protein LCGC14_1276040 [marine sediment metagenome]|uniref:DUF3854 domain-containing protein n=1 Tax=marine sediment metagenome TaxID=412755 RepID=A0A0F9ND94_9ZZZZ
MLRVNKNNPCPICGRPNWCLVEEDGSAAICQRISEGSKKKAGDAGWLHILIDRPPQQRRRYVKPKPPPGPAVNWDKLVADYRKDFCMEGACALFGVSAVALDDILIGWDPQKNAHTFPLKDGKGNIIGIRLRTLDGHQFSVPGSKNGLILPLSVKADSDELLFFPEGPTDCAAMLDLGFSPVGRASCGTGYQYIKEMIEHCNRQVVIFADKDEAKFTPDGKKYFPGYDGGLKLARSIKPFVSSSRLIKPPEKKDIRAWYLAGCTRAAVLALVKNAKFI